MLVRPLRKMVLLLLLCAGASTPERVAHLPGSEVASMQRFLVVHRDGDPRHIENDIRDQLEAFGRQAEAVVDLPDDLSSYDAVVTYVDRYWWDITLYCIQLTLYFRDTRTGYVMATGSSRRGSLYRKTPSGHAALVLGDLFEKRR